MKMRTVSRRIWSVVTALMLVLGLCAALPQGTLPALAAEGSGTKSAPYVITTYNELLGYLGRNRGDLNALGSETYFTLDRDILSEDSSNGYYFDLTANSARTVHIDLAGHTLSRSAYTSDPCLFSVGKNVTLVMEDSAGTGIISATLLTARSHWDIFSVTDGGSLIVNGGTYRDRNNLTVEDGGIYFNDVISTHGADNGVSCSVTINGGTFESALLVMQHAKGSLTVNGGTFIQRSDITGLPKGYDGVLLLSSDYRINNCILKSLSDKTELYGKNLRSHMPENAKIYKDGTLTELSDSADNITAADILIFTPEAVKNVRWEGSKLCWGSYPNAYNYGLQLEKLSSAGSWYTVSNFSTYGFSHDFTGLFQKYGDGTYRVLLGAHSENGTLISLVTIPKSIAADSRTEISSAALAVTVPREGKTCSQPRINTDGIELSSAVWFKGKTADITKKMGEDDKFTEGGYYTLLCSLKPADGYKFADGITAAVNGNAAIVSGASDEALAVRYTFTALADDTLPEVNISIPEPADGVLITEFVSSADPDTVKVYDSTNTKNKVSWSNPPYMINIGTTKFKAGNTYTLKFKLSQSISLSHPDPDMLVLTDDTVVKVNGREAVNKGKSGIYRIYELTYEITAAVLKGDVNADGKVNLKDLVLLRRCLNKWGVEINKTNSDMNNDSSINLKDLVLLQRKLNKW